MAKIKLPDNWAELSKKEQLAFRRGLSKEQKSLFNKTMQSYRKATQRIGEMLTSGFEYRKKKWGKTYYIDNPEDIIPKMPKTITEKTKETFSKYTKKYIAEHSRYYNAETGKYTRGIKQYNKRFSNKNKKPDDEDSYPIGDAILNGLEDRINECYSYEQGLSPYPNWKNAGELEHLIISQIERYGRNEYIRYLNKFNESEILAYADKVLFYKDSWKETRNTLSILVSILTVEPTDSMTSFKENPNEYM